MKDIDELVQWYTGTIPLYETLVKKVEVIITDKLEQSHINYHSVTSRPKDLDSYINKAKDEKYSDPKNQIKDMAGIRIITYLESDVAKVAEIIEELFDVDKENSVNQSDLLGSDKVGYRSVQYVATLGEERCRLPEYKTFNDLCFEIQIRSLLQHAWAEISHDRFYKFTGALPGGISRRFYLLAGILEVVDREFVSISEAIDTYKSRVTEEITKDDLDLEINTISLSQYLSHKFEKLVKLANFVPRLEGDKGKAVVEELKLFGINTISELDKIVPSDYQDYVYNSKYRDLPDRQSFLGYVRDILLINDAKRYFEVSWRKAWTAMDETALDMLKHYDVDITEYLEKYDICIEQF